MRETLALYSKVFDDPKSYSESPPSDRYLSHLLADPGFITLIAIADGKVVGALSAYTMRKFEQERSEVYIYDLAVDADYRRRRIATDLIQRLKVEARKLGAWMIFVQADLQDDPAIRLYESLGVRESVLHFDIDPTEG